MTEQAYVKKLIGKMNVSTNSYDGLTFELICDQFFKYGDIGIVHNNNHIKKINLIELVTILNPFLAICVDHSSIYTGNLGKFLYNGFVDNQSWELNVNDNLCLSPTIGKFTQDLNQTPLIPIGIALSPTKIYFNGIKKFSTFSGTTPEDPSTPIIQYTEYVINPSNMSPATSYSSYDKPTSLVLSTPMLIGNITITATQFRIENSSNITVYDSLELPGVVSDFNISGITLPFGILKWKGRYKDSNNRWSTWSHLTQFEYLLSGIEAPAISYPNNVSVTGILNSITFSPPTVFGPLITQSFQIVIKDELSSVKYDSLELPYVGTNTHLLTCQLLPGQYTISYRFKGTNSIWYNWSPNSSFTILDPDWNLYNSTNDSLEIRVNTNTVETIMSCILPNTNIIVYIDDVNGFKIFTNDNTALTLKISGYVNTSDQSICNIVNCCPIDSSRFIIFVNETSPGRQLYYRIFSYNSINNTIEISPKYSLSIMNIISSPHTCNITRCNYEDVSNLNFMITICNETILHYALLQVSKQTSQLTPTIIPTSFIKKTIVDSYSATSHILSMSSCSINSNTIMVVISTLSNFPYNKIYYITVSPSLVISISNFINLIDSPFPFDHLSLLKISDNNVLLSYTDTATSPNQLGCMLITNISSINGTHTISSNIQSIPIDNDNNYGTTFCIRPNKSNIIVGCSSSLNFAIFSFNESNNEFIYLRSQQYTDNIPCKTSSYSYSPTISYLVLSSLKIGMFYIDDKYANSVSFKFINL